MNDLLCDEAQGAGPTESGPQGERPEEESRERSRQPAVFVSFRHTQEASFSTRDPCRREGAPTGNRRITKRSRAQQGRIDYETLSLCARGGATILSSPAMAAKIGVSMDKFDDNFLTVLRNGMSAYAKTRKT